MGASGPSGKKDKLRGAVRVLAWVFLTLIRVKNITLQEYQVSIAWMYLIALKGLY